MKYTLPLFLLTLLLGAGCATQEPLPINTGGEPPVEMPVEEPVASESSQTLEAQLSGDLIDVSGGSASGVAQLTTYRNPEETRIMAIFEDLPDPSEGFFYEGWIVRKGANLSVLSTGKARQNEDGTWSNLWTASEDYLDHVDYVLTLEPDDGDPAPADHILDGVLTPVESAL